MASPAQRRRAARHQLTNSDAPPRRTTPITVDAILDAAFGIVEREGYEALTMRRVAAALETGSASLYAHVVNKKDLDELLIGRLCAEIPLPEPDPRRWRQQLIDVCNQIRDQYRRYPGISLAALAGLPINLDTLRLSEGMLSIVLAGGVAPQTATWGIDAIYLYVNAFCVEVDLHETDAGGDARTAGSQELRGRYAGLPDTFPSTKRYAAELTSGRAVDRFAFTLNVILDGLVHRQ